MYKKNVIIFALIFFIIILGAGLFFWPNLSDYFSSPQDSEQNNQGQEGETSDLIKARYDKKIVYNNEADLEKVENDCAQRGGIFDDCGAVCPPGPGVCVQVCGKVCLLEEDDSENEQENGNLLNYNNEDLGFSLKYPQDTQIKTEAENRIEFLWLASQQELGTEITDGVRVLVSKLDLPANTSLRDHLEERINNTEGIELEILSDIELENEYDYATYAYTVSSLGEYRHLVAPINSQKYFDISIFTSHDRYQIFVNELLGTFKITDPEKISTQKTGKITVEKPLLAQNIFSPLEIKGQAVGNWFFEGSFKISLVDWDGKIITETNATAQGDWMTEEMVAFEADLEFERPEDIYSPKAILIFQKSNPSGLPENDEALEYFVYFD